jgi:hypothetical protein
VPRNHRSGSCSFTGIAVERSAETGPVSDGTHRCVVVAWRDGRPVSLVQGEHQARREVAELQPVGCNRYPVLKARRHRSGENVVNTLTLQTGSGCSTPGGIHERTVFRWRALRVRGSERQASGRPTFGTAAFSLSDADGAKIVAEACRPPSDVGVPVTQWSAHRNVPR